MENQEPANKSKLVNNIFSRISSQYDLLNWLMTCGFYKRWEKKAIDLLEIHENQTILDIGCGTGELAFFAKQEHRDCRVFAGDFTIQMMLTGKQKRELSYFGADALMLPFQDSSFDRVISGYLMRNVADLDLALREQWRVLKSGGRIVILDTTRPGRSLLSPFIRLHMHVVIPFLGWLISGAKDAYCYLPESSEQFLTAEDLTQRILLTGFTEINFKRFMFGTVAIHWANKP
jgi:demethylmenaquinone methyltransferase/2-methoxy-6-polyprenyl-1,4-benzoquinol methylase